MTHIKFFEQLVILKDMIFESSDDIDIRSDIVSE